MAQFVRRRGRKVYVYYFDRAKGRQVQLPRAQTKHLDREPDENAEAWLIAWEKEHGLERDRIRRQWLKPEDEHDLWQGYHRHAMTVDKIRPGTWEQIYGMFQRHVSRTLLGSTNKKTSRNGRN